MEPAVVAAASGSPWLPSQIWKGEWGIPGVSPQVSHRVLTLRLSALWSCSTRAQEAQSGAEMGLEIGLRGPSKGKGWAWLQGQGLPGPDK